MSELDKVNDPEPMPTDGHLPPCRTWDKDQVAARLGCSWRTVLRMADAGKMPWGFKLGSLRRWDVDAIEQWIATGAKSVRQLGSRK